MAAPETSSKSSSPSLRASAARRPAAGLWLALLCLAVWLPGFASLPVVDRDESRFLLAARGMVESGDLWVPRLGDRPRLEKPPLATWLQAATIGLATGGEPARDAPWMGRLPSLLAALATVLAIWRLGGRWIDPRASWLGALLLGLSPLVVSQVRQARADLVLLLPTTLCLFALGSVWRFARRGRPIPPRTLFVFWFALLAGVLAKGPITPWIVVATVAGIAWRGPAGRRWEWLARLRPVYGSVALLGIVALLVGLQSREAGGALLAATAYRETIGRIVTGVDGHFAPPGLHALLAPALLWPGSLGLFGGLGWSWRGARGQRGGAGRPASRFLLAWALPAWLGFELAATKLPHYPLPLYVPLLLLSARWLLRLAARSPVAWPRRLRFPLFVWQALPPAVLPASVAALAWLSVGSTWLAAGLAAATAIPLVAAARAARSRPTRALGWALLGWAIALIAAGLLLPRWQAPWIANRLAAAVRSADPDADRPLADAAWREASLPLLTRRPVARLRPQEVDAWLTTHPAGLALIRADDARRWRVLSTVEGIDPVHGRRVELALVTGPAEPPPLP